MAQCRHHENGPSVPQKEKIKHKNTVQHFILINKSIAWEQLPPKCL
jgi:hypothetical protein